jgi:arylsulfatase A-like enzyme
MTDQAISWIEQQDGEPFFVHVSYIRPHPPYRCPAGYHDLYSADDVAPFVAHPTREAEQATHPLAGALLGLPGVGADDDERERRQMRATYHGMQTEVDAQLGRLFNRLEETGLAADTLVVVTSDHGEMGGDHWCIQKAGWWDETYHVPLIVCDPRAAADGGRGTVVDAFTEAVDVMPTILEWIGAEVPEQADGWTLRPFLAGDGPPEHWRSEAHFEWDFRNAATGLAEAYFGIPSAHCLLNVVRSATTKFVQFAASADVLPPLLFDLDADPGQLRDVSQDPDYTEARIQATEHLLAWRMRNDDRTLANTILTADRGSVSTRDSWR